jgi:hypothetical protein
VVVSIGDPSLFQWDMNEEGERSATPTVIEERTTLIAVRSPAKRTTASRFAPCARWHRAANLGSPVRLQTIAIRLPETLEDGA